jgi:hypothetical protein
MEKKNNLIKTARTTIARVKREMQMSRLTESVRNDGIDQEAPVVEEHPARPESFQIQSCRMTLSNDL